MTTIGQGACIRVEFYSSNQGEFFLPFVVTVRLDHIASSLGDIKNLFHFANLAKTDWREAVDLFYSSEFISLFDGTESSYESLYRGLSEIPGNEQNVEEFLISINKKQPMAFFLDQKEVQFEYTSTLREIPVVITRSGWGYSDLQISVDGDFLFVDRQNIRDDDFSATSCLVKLRVRPDRLHMGNNFGRVIFSNAFTSVVLPVTLSVNVDNRRVTAEYQEKKRLTVELVKAYESFSCKKITPRAWLSETGKIITKMNALDENSLEFRLYTAHYYITAGRVNEGKWLLDQMGVEFYSKRMRTIRSARADSL